MSSPTTRGAVVKREVVISSKKVTAEGGSLSLLEKEEGKTKSVTSEEDSTGLKGFLEEAGKMLKGMQLGSTAE